MLGKEFFNRNAVMVAKELLGKNLIKRRGDGKKERFIITETEAYGGFNDLASHASRGKTQRNAPMFEEAGTIYVYFTYGMHWMLNIVCGPKGHPSGVLIRGVASPLTHLTNAGDGKIPKLDGPGKLTRFLKIEKSLNGKKLGKKTGLWVEHSKFRGHEKVNIKRTTRIGVSYAGEIWANKKWRFVLESKTD